jgi:biotin operon repressor
VINSHYSHFAYDALMELLASIPRFPLSARLKDLARDLGIATSQEVRVRVDKLRRMGIGIFEEAQQGGAVVAVRQESWDRARALAETYWAKLEAV